MKVLSVCVALLCSVVPPVTAAQQPPSLVAADRMSPANYLPRVEKLSDRYRLTVETPDALPHYLIDKNEKRVWLRLVRPNSYPSQVLQGDRVVKEVKLIRHRKSSDVIIKLGEDAKASDVYFEDGRKRIVVDVLTSPYVTREHVISPVISVPKPAKKKKDPTPIAIKAPVPTMPPAVKATPTLVPPRTPAEKREGTLLVVIDAGHGGLDPGAIGGRGTMEKDVNLVVARALAKQLAKEKNVRVVMTRDSDVLVPLEERTRIANDAGADLFISIHCNSSLTSKSTGFEVYFLAPDATDKAAASVARMENSVVNLEVKRAEPSSRLSEVLASMAVGNYINESSKFASHVCRHVRQETSQDKAQVKEADFFVLRGAQMPSILIELEYLSNPLTEIKLRSSRYQSQIVDAVVNGIKSYTQQTRREQEALASQLPRSLPSQ